MHQREPVTGEVAVDVDDELLALPHVGDAVEAESAERPLHCATLRVEDLGLEHDVDDDAGHGALQVTAGGGVWGSDLSLLPTPHAVGAADYRARVGSRGYDLLWGTTLRTVTRVHRVLDRASGGRLGRHFPGGQQVIWVTTLGRRSGEWRRNPLLASRDGDGPDSPWIVAGSNVGQEKVPAWVFNMRANPEGRVEVDGVERPATFTEAVGADRDALYARQVALYSAFARYERAAGRVIPVFRVFPRPSDQVV